MASAKIKKGDTVVVLSGKDKGKSGEVTKVMPKDGKLIVSGANVAIRHRKPTQQNPAHITISFQQINDRASDGSWVTSGYSLAPQPQNPQGTPIVIGHIEAGQLRKGGEFVY